jgi:hypothetical protein
MSKPTERAEFRFQRASQILATSILQTPADSPMVAPNGALIELAYGLMEMSVGLRATYILLEEVKHMLQRAGRS